MSVPLTSLASRAAASAPGRRALAALTLARLAAARRRGQALAGALETVRRARFLAERGHHAQARRLLASGARRLRDLPEASVLAVEDAVTALDAGVGPCAWLAALRSHLAIADRVWRQGGPAREAVVEELVSMALRVVFHREVQFGDAGELTDPQAGLRALQASACWQALSGARALPGHRGGAPRPVREPSDPVRLAVVATKNFTFVRGLIADYEADPRVEVRVVDLAEPGVLPAVPRPRDILAARLRLLRGSSGLQAPHGVREVLQWADTVLVEWGASAAAWVSLVAPTLGRVPRVVVRLHSYEASTAWPHLTDWQAVDTLLTVSPPISRLLEDTVAGLDPHLSRPRRLTLPNRAELGAYDLPKEPGARRTVAVVGWASRRKDPAWALDVLDALRSRDPAWRLLLIGPDFTAQDLAAPGARGDYARAVARRLEEAGGAVTVTGRTSEVARYLRGAGVVLSASRREGTHEGFIEGVASGALPVCRRWPDLAAWGGPQGLFPQEWLVDTPQQAAERIEALDAGGERGRAARDRARHLVLSQRDWPRVRPDYDRLLLVRTGGPDPLS